VRDAPLFIVLDELLFIFIFIELVLVLVLDFCPWLPTAPGKGMTARDIEDEDDWGSGGRNILENAELVCIEAID